MDIGLVLSGGMAKGAYQIGALRAIRNYIPFNRIKFMSCASVGVLNGYAYATDALDQAEMMWRRICTDDTRLIITQILRSSLLQHNITKLYDADKTLASTFYCALLDIGHKNIVYKDLSTVHPDLIPLYLKASVAMPIYNRAVRIDGASYFDGAMVDNIPVHPLLKHDLDIIICIYFDDTCYKFENTYFDDKIIKITFPCETMLKESVFFKNESIDTMIATGYERTCELLDPVFCRGVDDLGYIYPTIGYMNRSSTSQSLRITGDVLVTNLNKITQKLTKRKII